VFRLLGAQHAQPAALRDGTNLGGGRRRAAVSEARIERAGVRISTAVIRRAAATTRANTPEADFRDYGIGAQILRDVGVRKMIIMSDATPRLANLPGYGLEIVARSRFSTNGKHTGAAK